MSRQGNFEASVMHNHMLAQAEAEKAQAALEAKIEELWKRSAGEIYDRIEALENLGAIERGLSGRVADLVAEAAAAYLKDPEDWSQE